MCAITDRTAEGNISKSLVSIVTALWTTISSAQKWMDGMGWDGQMHIWMGYWYLKSTSFPIDKCQTTTKKSYKFKTFVEQIKNMKN